MCGCRCCVSSIDSCWNTFLVLRLYLKSSIPSGSPARKGREVHKKAEKAFNEFAKNPKQALAKIELKKVEVKRTNNGVER